MEVWNNIFLIKPALNDDIMFLLHRQVHVGRLLTLYRREIKFVWWCGCCCEEFDMDLVIFDENPEDTIVWWFPIPKIPEGFGITDEERNQIDPDWKEKRRKCMWED